jgi:hypothetical protein
MPPPPLPKRLKQDDTPVNPDDKETSSSFDNKKSYPSPDNNQYENLTP